MNDHRSYIRNLSSLRTTIAAYGVFPYRQKGLSRINSKSEMLLPKFIVQKCIKSKTRTISLQNLSEQGGKQPTSEIVKMAVDSFTMILLHWFLGIKVIYHALSGPLSWY